MTICVNIRGGLGNQFFQYAIGRSLSSSLNVDLLLDIEHYKNSKGNFTQRQLELGQFNISAKYAKQSEIPLAAKMPKLGSILKRTKLKQFYGLRFEQGPEFDQSLLKTKRKKLYLSGYWQSFHYFEHLRNELLEELTLKEFPESCRPLLQKISETNSVSLHIRRGDYLSDSKNQNIYENCSTAYYKSAIDYISRSTKEKISLFIFTDDPAWVKENLDFDNDCIFVSELCDEGATVELSLMSKCKHHITANSTFSWWGAWLSQSTEKIIVTPKSWFKTGREISDLIPETWEKR